MSTATNGIATKGDCNNLCPYNGFSGNLTECVTKADVDSSGNVYLKSGHTASSDTQLVKYNQIASRWYNVSNSTFTIITKNSAGKTIQLPYFNVTVKLAVTVKSPTYASGTNVSQTITSGAMIIDSNFNNVANGVSLSRTCALPSSAYFPVTTGATGSPPVTWMFTVTVDKVPTTVGRIAITKTENTSTTASSNMTRASSSTGYYKFTKTFSLSGTSMTVSALNTVYSLINQKKISFNLTLYAS